MTTGAGEIARRLSGTMRARSADVGIGVSATSVRVVVLRRGRLEWHGERALSDASALDQALAELLAAVPPRRGRRTAVAAVGPSAMHLRRIADLPATVSERLLTAIVREDAARYFVQSGPSLAITQACRRGGAVWVGALERAIATSIATACARHGIRLTAIVPVVDLAGSLVEHGALQWPDGPLTALAGFEASELVTYRRMPTTPACDADDPPRCPAPAIDGMAGDASRFTDAWLAAKAGMGHRLAYRPEASPEIGADVRRARLRLSAAAVGCVTAALAALAMPLVSARHAEWRSHQTLTSLRSSGREAVAEERALALAARELRALAAFDRSARPMTVMLASLTAAIEPPTMLLSLQSDSAGATLVAVTPSPAELIGELSNVPGIAAPALVGAVTPVLRAPAVASPMPGGPASPSVTTPDDDGPMQRVSIHFTWRGGATPGVASREGR